MSWDENLTGAARYIAESDDSPLRVVAGPGTGKSFALKRRVARLIETGAEPRRILAITFTRNAAANLVDDLSTLGIENAENITVGTLHSFCFRMLKRSNVFQLTNRRPRPLVYFPKLKILRFEAYPMLSDILQQIGVEARAVVSTNPGLQ